MNSDRFLYSPVYSSIAFRISSDKVIDVLTFILQKYPKKNTLSSYFFMAPESITMATYFPSETDQEKYTGCGVCAVPCPASAVKLVRKSNPVPPKDFKELHQEILKQRKPAA
jgi:Pyruvate/2-oxoacid:ferredoxin oxidoreductase delta subunit